MTQPYSNIQAIKRPDKTTKKTQVRGETKSKEEVKGSSKGTETLRQEGPK